MPDRPDRRRLGRKQNSTSSTWREKQAVDPPLAGQGRGKLRGTRLGRVDAAGGSMSQTGLSQAVDPTQYHLLEQRVFHNIRLFSFDDNKVLKIINWIC